MVTGCGWAAAAGMVCGNPLPPALTNFLGDSFFHTQALWSEETGGRSHFRDPPRSADRYSFAQ